MFYTVLQLSNTYRAGDFIDVVCYGGATLRVRVTGASANFPANAIQILIDGSNDTPNLVSNSANTTSVSTAITITSTDFRDYYLVKANNVPEVYGRDLIIEALDANNNVLKSERFYINSPASKYKKVSFIPSLESAIADYTARMDQIRAMRSKSYQWNIDIVVDPPPAPELYFALPPTQVFGIENLFEPRAFGQGIDMISNAQIFVPFAVLSPALSRFFSMLNQYNLDKLSKGRGIAMVEFYNDYYSLVLNDVFVAPQIQFNANGLENNANENASGIMIILTGRSQFELISGFTDKQPI